MRPDLRERRERTWELYVLEGQRYSTVVEAIASEYDVSDRTIEQDIRRMPNWLPKLDEYIVKTGASRIRELTHLRQRLHQMRRDAQMGEEWEKELKLIREVRKNVNNEVDIAQSLDILDQTPEQHEHHHHDGDIDDEAEAMYEAIAADTVDSATEVDDNATLVRNGSDH